jgi:hypothetical protein
VASNYPNILNDMATLLVPPAVPENASVVTRKVLQVFESDQPALDAENGGLIIIVPMSESKGVEAFGGQITIRYRVGIAAVFAGNQQYTVNIDLVPDALDLIRQTLHVTRLPTATTNTNPPGVFNSDVSMNPQFDDKALRDGNYDFGLLEVIYDSAELRN